MICTTDYLSRSHTEEMISGYYEMTRKASGFGKSNICIQGF